MLKKTRGLFSIFPKTIALGLILGASLTACGADKSSWKEEVKLLDGRVIVVDLQRRYEGAYNGSPRRAEK